MQKDWVKQAVHHGRYDLIRELGSGALGVVYEAFDHQRQHRVALKELRETGPEQTYRLKREFRALASLSHPNLVEIYDLVIEAERCFFTMEVVDGVDFATHCRGGRDPDQALRVDLQRLCSAGTQLVRGIQALHRQGLLHRDLKPSNVLVTRSGRVVILDFGMAADQESLEQLTLTSQIVGTPAYMAPEQAAAERELTPAADWYALGATLYHAISGRPPFVGSPLTVLRRKAVELPVVPQEQAAHLPEALCALTTALLAIEPERRPGPDAILRALQWDESSGAPQGATIAPAAHEPFIGRDAELAAMHAAFSDASAGRAAIVVVQGDSGYGKSALLAQFAAELEALPTAPLVLRSRCFERERIPYRAVDGLIDGLSAHWKRLSHAQAMYLLPHAPQVLPRVFPVLGRVPEVAATGASLAIADPVELRRRGFAALRETLQRLASGRPLLLCLDDSQWIDTDTVSLLCSIFAGDDPPALLLLIATRSIGERSPLQALLAEHPASTKLSLRPLAEDETRELIENVVADAPPQAVATLVRESGGNPFLAAELARYLAGENPRQRPGVLAAMLRERFDQLTPEARDLLQAAAIAAEPCSISLLAQATQQSAEATTRSTRALVARRLLRIASNDAEDSVEMYHDSIREGLVAWMTPEQRVATHRAIASTLERLQPEAHERCTRHWLEAGGELQAARHARAAAEAADRALNFDLAARYYRLHLDLAGPLVADATELTTRLAVALRNAGQMLASAETFLKAAASSTKRDEELEYRHWAGAELLRCGHVSRGMELLRSIATAVELEFPGSARSAALAALAERAKLRLRGMHVRERAEHEVHSALLTQIDVCFSVTTVHAFAEPSTVYLFQTRNLRRALQAGEPYRLSRALAMEAIITAAAGGKGAAAADSLLMRAGEFAARTPRPHGRAFVAAASTAVAFFQGKWRVCLERAAQAERLLRDQCTGTAWELDSIMMYATLSLFYLGELRELSLQRGPMLREAQDRRDLYAQTILCGGPPSLCWLAADRPDEAQAQLDAVMRGWQGDVFALPHLWEIIVRVYIALYRGDPVAAAEGVAAREHQLQGSYPMRIQTGRLRLLYVRACASLAAHAVEGANTTRWLAAAQTDLRSITREHCAGARPLGLLIRAAVEAALGQSERVVPTLELAERELRAQDMLLYLEAARYRRAQFVGGDAGATLKREVEAWMAEQGVLDPARLTDVLAPAFSKPARA